MPRSNDLRPVGLFLALTFGLAWATWEIPDVLGIEPNRLAILVPVGAFAPAIAAAVVRKGVERSGWDDAGLALHPEQWCYYLGALLIPVFVVGFVAIAAPVLGLGWPHAAPSDAWAAIPSLLLVSVIAGPVLWGEEFGWRSYLQLRLFAGRPLIAAIATGLIWGVWHFPLLMRAPELPLHPIGTLILFPVATVFYSVILGWLRLRSGSVWCSSVGHSAFNNFRSPMLALLFAGLPDMLPVALIGLAAVVLIARAIVASGGLRSAARPSRRH